MLIHELTHAMEVKKRYEAFKQFISRYIEDEMGADVETLRAHVKSVYAEWGHELTDESAQREIVAKFCEHKLFQDEAAIKRLFQFFTRVCYEYFNALIRNIILAHKLMQQFGASRVTNISLIEELFLS